MTTKRKDGKKEMYAVIGRNGGIYGLLNSYWKAQEARDKLWNLGRTKPRKYLVTIEEADDRS